MYVYNIIACDLCEQLRDDLVPLSMLEGRRGFDSIQFQSAVEMLYQEKTKHEDIDVFKAATSICKYCADKLKSGKEVARNVFNCLSVPPVPDCISALNLFEKVLTKFCMTFITVIRLGHVSSTNRPQKELTAALKGRIAYLPVDVEANAKFLPENLLNLDSLVF